MTRRFGKIEEALQSLGVELLFDGMRGIGIEVRRGDGT